MTRTPSRTRTRTTRSSEHAAHRPLMHSVHTSHLWLKVSPCVSFHVIHACAPVCCSLSVSPHPSFYFLVLFLLQLYLMSNSAPDEFSIEIHLCNSSLGSMVTLDYVTPLTVWSLWCGTPSMNSAQRRSEVHHVGRFLCACAALGIPANEHSPFVSAMWTRPWSFSHIDFCAGGRRFRKAHWCLIIHCGTPSCQSLQCRSAYKVCTFTGLPHRHWKISNENIQFMLAAKMPRRIAVFVVDCLRRKCGEHHRIQTFKSGQRMLGYEFYCYSLINKDCGTCSVWWWDVFYGGGIFTLSLAEVSSSSAFQALCLKIGVIATSMVLMTIEFGWLLQVRKELVEP